MKNEIKLKSNSNSDSSFDSKTIESNPSGSNSIKTRRVKGCSSQPSKRRHRLLCEINGGVCSQIQISD